MILKSLSLTQYKNISSDSFEFDDRINCFIGNNGVGKSNILDAIYHLCFAKGYFNPTAVQNIQFNTDFFLLDGIFEKNNQEEKVVCSLKKGQKKTLKRNGKVYDKISDHIGLLPLVIISPSDRDLITEGSSIRRKFMDGVIGQTDSSYLNNLLDYTKISDDNDVSFAKKLTKEIGVASIPISVFYKNPPKEQKLRFCFAKDDASTREDAST